MLRVVKTNGLLLTLFLKFRLFGGLWGWAGVRWYTPKVNPAAPTARPRKQHRKGATKRPVQPNPRRLLVDVPFSGTMENSDQMVNITKAPTDATPAATALVWILVLRWLPVGSPHHFLLMASSTRHSMPQCCALVAAASFSSVVPSSEELYGGGIRWSSTESASWMVRGRWVTGSVTSCSLVKILGLFEFEWPGSLEFDIILEEKVELEWGFRSSEVNRRSPFDVSFTSSPTAK